MPAAVIAKARAQSVTRSSPPREALGRIWKLCRCLRRTVSRMWLVLNSLKPSAQSPPCREGQNRKLYGGLRALISLKMRQNGLHPAA